MNEGTKSEGPRAYEEQANRAIDVRELHIPSQDQQAQWTPEQIEVQNILALLEGLRRIGRFDTKLQEVIRDAEQVMSYPKASEEEKHLAHIALLHVVGYLDLLLGVADGRIKGIGTDIDEHGSRGKHRDVDFTTGDGDSKRVAEIHAHQRALKRFLDEYIGRRVKGIPV